MQTLQNPICLKNMFLEPLSPNATGFLHPRLIVHYVQGLIKNAASLQFRPACTEARFPVGDASQNLVIS